TGRLLYRPSTGVAALGRIVLLVTLIWKCFFANHESVFLSLHIQINIGFPQKRPPKRGFGGRLADLDDSQL
ncbi:MAG: hypothetical protein J5833_06355, partial [Victivallales bacterium]|nr:hypothetical protein [Victivallales bacterium]